MQNNYFFLKHLSQKLNETLASEKLVECFTQNKDELLLKFTNKVDFFYIKALLSPSFTCLSFPTEYKRANSNTTDLFQKLIGKTIQNVQQHTHERAFSIHFDKNSILTFKLFGNKSNMILFENGTVSEIFLSNIKSDKLLKIDDLDRTLNISYKAFVTNNFDIEKTFPTLGKRQVEEIKNEYLRNNNLQSIDNESFFNFIQTYISNFSKPNFYIFYKNELPFLSLLPSNNIQETFHDSILAVNDFFLKYSKTEAILKEKSKIISDFESKILKLKKTELEVKSRLKNFAVGATNEQIGHILMANLHEKVVDKNKIELFDFYRNESILIKIKEGLSLQKNAENYYRKAKNEKIEVKTLETKLQNLVINIEKLVQDISIIKEIEDIKTLRKYSQKNSTSSSTNTSLPELPFKVVDLDGWQILIGKNAQNNDLLTQKYAKKDDLWLHARDVAGSHVVIRHQAGKVFPKNIVERAAELAAFYSKRKTDTVCSVIVTPKKYVRKPKNLPAGKVIVEKESTLLVSPKGP